MARSIGLLPGLQFRGPSTSRPDDRHVLAVAIALASDAIVTFNLKDFRQTGDGGEAEGGFELARTARSKLGMPHAHELLRLISQLRIRGRADDFERLKSRHPGYPIPREASRPAVCSKLT